LTPLDTFLDIGLVALFGLLAGVVAYVYLGYPLLLWVVARLRPRPLAAAAPGRSPLTVSFVVPARDEERWIAEKVDDCLAQAGAQTGRSEGDYPADRVEVVVVSDGSTDATAEIVRDLAATMVDHASRVRLVEIPPAGKGAALAAALVRLLSDRSLARRLGERAAQEARTRFAWSRVARDVLDAYGEIR
jgi:cellulose synthase/poly-beta-1,6-N-acetylglucosamine synthase-like glycosyltransferase